MPVLKIRDVVLHKALLSPAAQQEMVQDLRKVVRKAPLFSPRTPSGKAMSVRMTAAGDYGWFSDRTGYRYIPTHPRGTPWPEIPRSVLEVWDAVSNAPRGPECCLLNYYGASTKMGMHQDKDEADFALPVVSVSLGDPALFRIGNTVQGGKTESVWLESGDVLVMSGPARLVYHGIDRIRFGASSLLADGGRINLTLRVVT